MKTLLVEGWRFICQSYAIVNQWQLLSLRQHTDIRLVVRDLPYFRPDWRPMRGIFDPAAEEALQSIPTVSEVDRPDATLRIAAPYNFSPAPTGCTAVFGTAEYGVVTPSLLPRALDVTSLAAIDNLKIVAPSSWSASGFRKLGFRADQVVVVPIGVDVATFAPPKEPRELFRKRFNLGLKGFVFGNFGALTWNKGVDVLLRAFAVVAEKRPNVSLIIKGVDAVYPSQRYLPQYLAGLSARARQLVADRLFYMGNAVSMQNMADMYRMCDVYVSPYRAEGFNMPVLEAAACGLPVICTAGGPTDEFISDRFARRIESTIEEQDCEGVTGQCVNPNLDALIDLMVQAVDDEDWRARSASEGPRHVAENYTWDRVVSSLLQQLMQ